MSASDSTTPQAGLCLLDAHGRIVQADDRAHALLGPELMGTTPAWSGTHRAGNLQIDVAVLPGHPTAAFAATVHDVGALLVAQARLADAQRFAHIASWDWEPDSDAFTISGLVEEAGVQLAEHVRLADVLWYIREPDRSRVRSDLARLVDGEIGELHTRYAVEPPNAAMVFVESHARAVRDADGRCVLVQGTTQDMSEHWRAGQEAERARDFLQTTLDSLPAHVAVLDEAGTILVTNAAWRAFARATSAGDVCVGADYFAACERAPQLTGGPEAAGPLRDILAGEREDVVLEYPWQQRWFVLRARRHEGDGPARVVVQHQDTTDRQRAIGDALLRARLLDEVDAAVIATDLDGRFTHWNECARQLYGYPAAETLGRPASEFPLGIDTALLESGHWDGEFELRRKDGSTFPAYARATTIAGADGRPAGAVTVIVDDTERVRAERELRAAGDYLRAVTDSMGEGMFTIDDECRLVYMNAAAERMLGRRAEDLRGRSMDVIARGPDIALPSADGRVVEVADDVFVRADGTELYVAYTAAPFETAAGIRGSVVVFADITERRAEEDRVRRELESLTWIGRIRRALEGDRFVLHAQPIIDLHTGSAVQHELLLRMLDDDGSLIAPDDFLPTAEQYGLIRDIDHWVIRAAAQLAGRGHPLELNVSADSLGDPGLFDLVERALREAGADPELLVIEITETALLRNEAAGSAFMERARGLGCRLALDDFGTGYGGFTYLKRLPVDYLKIDREFVRDLRRDSASRHVVSAVVNLAKGFGQRTVAEGVEDPEVVGILRELGVDYAQGFAIGRPAPVEQLLARRDTPRRTRGALPTGAPNAPRR